MKISALFLGFVVVCAAAFTGCGNDMGGSPVQPAQTKELVAFSFSAANNPGLTANVSATISGSAISATVPFGTNLTALVATFDTTGASVTVGGVPQISGVTPNNFSTSVTYRVTAADATTRDYTVAVTVAPSTAKQLTAFAFLAAKNAGLVADVTATITGTTVAATVPSGTNVTALVATFSTTGASVTVGGTSQVSGTTANNFTSPVTYRVTAADGSTQDYSVTVTVAPSSAKEITAFVFESVHNAGLGANVTATINGTSITANVPFGTIVTGLVATFSTTGMSVTVGSTAQVSGTTANNFTAPVAYKVTAADGSTKIFTVTVTIAGNPAKEITAFAFESVHNAGLVADVTATINGTAIAATVPFGTDRTALKATFSSSGASVSVAGTTQVSGVTANNFTAPVIYRVTAADSSTKDFTVTVIEAPSPAKEIIAYSFLSANNPGLGANVTATINGNAIAATVPFGTDRTALKATFSTTGTTVTVAGTDQVSGVTANNFTAPVIYRVTAADGSTKDFTVTVTEAPSDAKDITFFAFASVNNGGLGADVTATITGTSIAATVPFGTDVTALIATFSTTGATITVAGTPQVSGITANDFTAPAIYHVTAADNSTQDFTVTVTVAQNPAKDITAYAFLSANNPTLGSNVTATITGTAIAATVPFGTNVTGLIATFSKTGASVTVAGIPQVSGITANDFTAPVIYHVTAADNSTQDFTVTVTVAPAPKDITSYSFLAANNPSALTADITATITGTSIAATVPFGTNITALVATFTTTGTSVTVGGVVQVSGTTANNFTSPVLYRVTGADGLTQDFTVTVTVALNPAKDITAYSFQVAQNAGLATTSTGTITGTAISIAVQPGFNITNMVATFTLSTGASVAVGGVTQTSAVTPNDFTSPVIYTVTAADGTTKDFTVTVTVLVTSFSFTGAAGNEATFPSDGTNAKLAGIPTMGRVGGTATNAGNVFVGSAWTSATLDTLHYFTFTVTPKTGEMMTLTNFAFKNQRSATGPLTLVVRSSRDNFAADLLSTATPAPVTLVRNEILLGANFANVTVPVEFRMYAFGASAAAGTWRIDDVQLTGVIVP